MISYETWLNRMFGGTTLTQHWPNIDLDAVTTVGYFERTLTSSGTDLLRFSDKQVNRGLWHLFQGRVLALRDGTVPAVERTAAIMAIKTLYTDCFARRARPALGHLSEPGTPVNSICFMLWDITYIGSWGSVADCDYFSLVLDVVEYALNLPHVACVESALHGLGHLGRGTKQHVPDVIERWQTKGTPDRPELLAYAQTALDWTMI